MITVYLDSSFYVWLARADSTTAHSAITELNRLQVRHVLSNVLIRELCSSKTRSAASRQLYERIIQLSLPPLKLDENLQWEILIAPLHLQEKFASDLRLIDDMMTDGHSHALIAERGLKPDQQEKWNQENRWIVDQLQDDQGNQDIQRMIAFIKKQIEALQPNGFDFGPVLAALESPNPDPLEISSKIFKAIGEENISRIIEEKLIQTSVTASDNRPVEVAMGNSSHKKKLGNTFRDAEHMSLFVQHADKIDLLQIDGPQEAQIRKARPMHRLVELGLDGRCFSASTLQEVTEKISNLQQTLDSGHDI